RSAGLRAGSAPVRSVAYSRTRHSSVHSASACVTAVTTSCPDTWHRSGNAPRKLWSDPSGVLAAGALLLLVACGPPVGVSRVSPREVSRDLTRSALSSNRPSQFSDNVLHRWDLRERFRRDPESALARLHQLAVEGRGRDTTLFALAEL